MSRKTTNARASAAPTERGGSRAAASPGTQAPVGAAPVGDDSVGRAQEPEDVHDPCRGIDILKRVGDKWSVYVIHMLGTADTLRFSELMRRIDGISQRMLTVTLRGLERDGLVRRTMYPEVPPRVEYALTPLGATLRGVVGDLVAWSVAHLPEIEDARARYDRQEPGWAADGE